MSQTISRRRIRAGLGTGAAAVAFASCTGKSATSSADPTATTLAQSAAASQLGHGSFVLFDQTDLNFQTLFALGEAGQVTAAGEVLAVVAQANATAGGATYQSLYDAWIAMADRLAGAEAAVYTVMNDALVAAMELNRTPAEQVSIPYSGGELPGWFLKPANDDTRRPTFIINNGSDGQEVDLLSQGGFAALDRGYNVLIFEGPGQGSQLFLDNVVFRPDWQSVVTPIVDWLQKRSDVTKDQIAIRGISFGGLLVPQAASQEHRLAALIADPGSMQSKDDYPPVIQDVINVGTAEQVNTEWNDTISKGATPIQKFTLMKSFSIFTQEAHDAAMQGQLPSDFYGLWTEIEKYDVTGVIGEITNPTMVTQYEGDTFFTTQGQEMYDGLKVTKKDLVEFTSVDGTQYHCGPANPQVPNEAILDWVDTILGH